MPFADAVDLSQHFGRYPPAHVAAAILCHWKPAAAERAELTDEDIRRMRGPIGGK